jgi:hypothetical protein
MRQYISCKVTTIRYTICLVRRVLHIFLELSVFVKLVSLFKRLYKKHNKIYISKYLSVTFHIQTGVNNQMVYFNLFVTLLWNFFTTKVQTNAETLKLNGTLPSGLCRSCSSTGLKQ